MLEYKFKEGDRVVISDYTKSLPEKGYADIISERRSLSGMIMRIGDVRGSKTPSYTIVHDNGGEYDDGFIWFEEAFSPARNEEVF